MAVITSFRSAEICRGVKWSAMIPCADIRECRAKVSSQSRGERCHSRESTSAATPASGHQQSGEAMKTRPANRRGLNIGMGSRARLIAACRSASAAERAPSATSASARRSSADPRRDPLSSSYLSGPTVHFPAEPRPPPPPARYRCLSTPVRRRPPPAAETRTGPRPRRRTARVTGSSGECGQIRHRASACPPARGRRPRSCAGPQGHTAVTQPSQ